MHRLSGLLLVSAFASVMPCEAVITASASFGVAVTVAGTGVAGAGSDQFHHPGEMFVDDDGNLYVADAGNDRVQKISTDGSVVETVAGGQATGHDRLEYPLGVVADGDGNLYVADRENHRVLMVPADGSPAVTVAGLDGKGSSHRQLNVPNAVFVDGGGNLYVADRENHRVLMVPADGSAAVTVAGTGIAGSEADQLSSPADVFVDGAGALYVADADNHRVQMVPADGSAAVTVAGTGVAGSGADQLSYPSGLFVDDGGNLYVSDHRNDRVQMFPADGSAAVTIAGTRGRGSGANQLHGPHGLFMDGTGTVYVADTFNHRVQKLVGLDTTDPVATIISPTSTIVVDDVVAIEFSCTDNWMVASCEGLLDGATIAAGSNLDTATAGTRTVSVTATDALGNTHSTTATVTVGEPEVLGPVQPEVVAPIQVACERRLQGAYAGLSGTDGALARLYMATFARQPDADGFVYWSKAIAGGTSSLSAATRHFAVSGEFFATYGNLNDGEFIDQIYRNVLCRLPDQAGKEYWLSALGSGTNRGRLLQLFSDSPEFRTLTS